MRKRIFKIIEVAEDNDKCSKIYDTCRISKQVLRRLHLVTFLITGLWVRTLLEKFVLYDQIGYLAFEFLDGKLVRNEAIKVIQMADAGK